MGHGTLNGARVELRFGGKTHDVASGQFSSTGHGLRKKDSDEE